MKPQHLKKPHNDKADTTEAAISEQIMSDDLRERTAKRAYELYLERGCRPGCDLEDWVDSEREILASPKGQGVTVLLADFGRSHTFMMACVSLIVRRLEEAHEHVKGLASGLIRGAGCCCGKRSSVSRSSGLRSMAHIGGPTARACPSFRG